MDDLVMDELKEIYNRENIWKQSIENKTSYLVVINRHKYWFKIWLFYLFLTS